jgi:hypothetical protein
MDTAHLFTETCDNGSTHAARIEDLGMGDFAKVDYAVCWPNAPTEFGRTPLLAYCAAFHCVLIPARAQSAGQGAAHQEPPAMYICKLPPRFHNISVLAIVPARYPGAWRPTGCAWALVVDRDR